MHSWGVINHAEHSAKVGGDARRVTAPGGGVRAMVYGRGSWVACGLWLRHALIEGRPSRSLSDLAATHMRSLETPAYTRRELRLLFEPAGFTRFRCSACRRRTVLVFAGHGRVSSGWTSSSQVALSVERSHSWSGIFTPSAVIPVATIIIRPFSSSRSSVITAGRRSGKCRLINSPSPLRARSTNVRETALYDVAAGFTSACSPTGSRVPPHRRGRHAAKHSLEHDPTESGPDQQSADALRARPRIRRLRSGFVAAALRSAGHRRYLRPDWTLSASSSSFAAPTSHRNAAGTRSGSRTSSLAGRLDDPLR